MKRWWCRITVIINELPVSPYDFMVTALIWTRPELKGKRVLFFFSPAGLIQINQTTDVKAPKDLLSQGVGAGCSEAASGMEASPRMCIFVMIVSRCDTLVAVYCCLILAECYVPFALFQLEQRSQLWDSLELFCIFKLLRNFASPGHCICVWIIALKSNAGLFISAL